MTGSMCIQMQSSFRGFVVPVGGLWRVFVGGGGVANFPEPHLFLPPVVFSICTTLTYPRGRVWRPPHYFPLQMNVIVTLLLSQDGPLPLDGETHSLQPPFPLSTFIPPPGFFQLPWFSFFLPFKVERNSSFQVPLTTPSPSVLSPILSCPRSVVPPHNPLTSDLPPFNRIRRRSTPRP